MQECNGAVRGLKGNTTLRQLTRKKGKKQQAAGRMRPRGGNGRRMETVFRFLKPGDRKKEGDRSKKDEGKKTANRRGVNL